MALINCIECDQKISELAKSCPNCGIPISKFSSFDTKNISNLSIIFSRKFWVSFQGRISRPQYISGIIILFFLLISIILFINIFSEKMLSGCNYYNYYECMHSIMVTNVILKIPFIFIFLYSLASISVKRFHDFNKCGYNIFTLAIPIVGFYFLWVLVSTKGDDGFNKYDENSSPIEKP
jgi:uncharacterized membrane protein YhaH (DUF805 family)